MGGPMGGIRAGGEKAKDFKKTMKSLMSYLKPYRLMITIVIIFAIGSAAFSIVGPKILGRATTALFEGLVSKVTGQAGAGIDFGYIGQIVIVLLVLYVISTVFSLIQGFAMSGIAQKVSYKMRKEISEKINRMPLKYFDTKTHGEVLSRVTNDVDTVSQTLNQSMSQIITSATTLIGVLIMMFSINWVMTLVALLIIPVSLGLISVVVKKSQRYFKSQQEYLGHVNGQVEEVYSGHNIVKAFNSEEREINTFNDLNDTLYKSAWKSQFLSGLMQPIMMFVGNLGYVLVSIIGGFLAIKGSIEVGDIQAFIQYVRSFTQPIAQTAQIANVLQSTAAAAERVFEFLDEEEEVKDVENPISTKEIIGEVEFNHVHFGYNPEKTIINDFTAKVKPGQRVAIVGPTGAGKTTMVKLLMRFYEVNEGNITIDGHNIKDFSRSDLRKMFGMVLQDTWLFGGTVKENIKYGNEEATDGEVIEEFEPEVVDTLDIPSEYLQAVKEGMRMVNTYSGNGTAYNSFNSFPIAVAGKTGTADFGSEENYTVIGRRPYGNYISFAPMDNPQIAIFSTLYDGNKGSEGATIHLAIYEAFFKELLESNYSNYTKNSESYQKYVANGLNDNKENQEENSHNVESDATESTQ